MIPLIPEADATGEGTAFVALSGRPWLRLATDWSRLKGRWVRLVYAQGLFDDPVRPLLRFEPSGEEITLPAPVLGRGIWVGRVPEGTDTVAISPAMRPGPMNFRVEAVERSGALRLFAASVIRRPVHAMAATALWVVGPTERARRRVARATMESRPGNYRAWRAARRRAFEPDFDLPHAAGEERAVMLRAAARGATAADIAATIASLQAQTTPHWQFDVDLTGAAADIVAAIELAAARDQRVSPVPRIAGPAIAADIRFGDRLSPWALALVKDRFAREPRLAALFGDGELGDRLPLLRGGWSDIAGTHNRTAAPVFRVADEGPVAHIRRPLVNHARALAIGREGIAASGARPGVTVIVPTRDRLDLLRACVTGVLEGTDYDGALDVIIVDNDSKEAATLAYLNEMARHPRVRVRRHPGAFNFAAICNGGAAEDTHEILLFLNNDIIVHDRAWLRHLVDFAEQPGVGAVGAKLLYPGGRLQHAGVALGLTGSAGHIYAGAPGNAAGLDGELTAPRELCAVTGACLAVSRAKFDAVGGFDAEHFAITLNDIDLCLRLRARGWSTIYTPLAVLEHRESASRPKKRVYDRELAVFRARWGDLVRDDPFFHPAFSTASLKPVLG